MNNISAVILAAGAGTRMKSQIPKVLHKVCGKPMVEHIIDVAEEVNAKKSIVVIGHKAEQVKEAIGHREVVFAIQKEQLGTGHAVMQAENFIEDEGLVLLLYGDTPLIKGETLKALINFHIKGDFQGTILTADFENPTGYGRIVRDHEGNVVKIVEEKDANEKEKSITEINSGMYCYHAKLLKEALKKITNDNQQQEYYITDVIEILRKEGHKVGAFKVEDKADIMGVNSRVQLAWAEKFMREGILTKHMEEGVTIIDPKNTYVEKNVKIGMDTVLYPGVILKGDTKIGEDCIIGHNTRIENSIIKNKVQIQSSTIVDSFVDEGCTIGPYAYLRPNSKLGKKVKIGDFVEVKNSSIDDGSKASHLAYVGDAEVGKNVNIGCGVVFVNYDGKNKYKSIVEDNAFVGSNVNLVAPVVVRKGGYVATGSTITKEVPEGALSVARERQKNIAGWVERKGLLKKD
ncbi:bifunctional UDP-N-acetylglucosamine diphosphorylase/glucosamine-1-phosphate N-acetyltransferase GlmU [Crassaminicella profunda]|uniref:bifunctional UDP-N-acetylglucosamine diphosphorylase/glucosamine-1-phosphate N-acetyltransferase GlmU n=1 Tax=Crassaminicella profunda TaxID=1286698 RepID=UPI001CA6B77B|nr:bifunctional UDP-N-acetylglucosamine diphosphorylase/glucosamine-1-phosphate N-acetyltransferase GlmU [Crassaminicella profunda]QZY54743.1 bifunctional UDP-N-acetylglucosamine diphosphorylase/glucosamine-1-phosphate N-acetyltransferase GlmU [Crassaminicella profunda]